MAGLSAGVYMGTGELGGVFDCSYRVQWWDFERLLPPLDLSSFDPWGSDEEGRWRWDFERSVLFIMRHNVT